MIRVRRGPEPDVLRRARWKWLARAVLAWADGATARQDADVQGEKIHFAGYDVAKAPLYDAQHRKCAYCERSPGYVNQPVEHFRPKAGAGRGDPRLSETPSTTDPDHYWWLAWTWENLFFACGTCNGKGTKENWFPLKSRSQPLPVPPRQPLTDMPPAHRTVTLEEPMLVDPSVDDPMEFLRWLPENPTARWEHLRWKPFGVDAEGRGLTTIQVLHLDRDLPGVVSAYVRAHVQPKMERLRRATAGKDQRSANDIWMELEKVFAPELPYLAACYDAVEWFLDDRSMRGVRTFVRKVLGRPGAVGTDVPLPDWPDSPAVVGLSDRLRLRVRAGSWTIEEGILALCAERAFRVDVLAELLEARQASVTRACRKLVREGRLAQALDATGIAVFEMAPGTTILTSEARTARTRALSPTRRWPRSRRADA